MVDAYVLDTSALIAAWVRLYPPEHFPNFWANLDRMAQQGRVLVPEEVLKELMKKQDDLLQWVKDREQRVLVHTTRAVMCRVREILRQYPGLTQPNTGRGKAGPFVIATALQLDLTVVTDEKGGSAHKPKIPYVCKVLGVECLTVLDIIQREQWVFY